VIEFEKQVMRTDRVCEPIRVKVMRVKVVRVKVASACCPTPMTSV
jgi:hypothetical protein